MKIHYDRKGNTLSVLVRDRQWYRSVTFYLGFESDVFALMSVDCRPWTVD